jgi:hypothetical protein
MLDTFFAEQEFSGHQSQQFKLYDVKILLVTRLCNTFLYLAGDMIDVLTCFNYGRAQFHNVVKQKNIA